MSGPYAGEKVTHEALTELRLGHPGRMAKLHAQSKTA